MAPSDSNTEHMDAQWILDTYEKDQQVVSGKNKRNKNPLGTFHPPSSAMISLLVPYVSVLIFNCVHFEFCGSGPSKKIIFLKIKKN